MSALGYFPTVLLTLLDVTGILKGSTLPAPSNVRFLSKNLQNVLHWKSPEENEARMWYTVQYKIYGESWKDKIECQNITKTYCDLSSETEDYDDYYYARVKAVSGASFSDWNQSSRFNPKGETNISAPRVYVEATNCSIAITFIGPEIWKSNNQTPVNPSLIDIFELKYNVSIFNKNSKKTTSFLQNAYNNKRLEDLKCDTTYCVTVRSLTDFINKQSEPSEMMCVRTPKDHATEIVILVIYGCVLPVLILVSVFVFCCCVMYKYVYNSNQKQPLNLLLQYHQPNSALVVLPPELLNINILVLENERKMLSHDCLETEDCKVSLLSQCSTECPDKMKTKHLAIDNGKNMYMSQTIQNSSLEHSGDRQDSRQSNVQPQQNDYQTQTHLLNRGDPQSKVEYGVIVMEKRDHTQESQTIQIPADEHEEVLSAGYKSRLPLQPLRQGVSQRDIEYGFITIIPSISQQYKQDVHLRVRATEKPKRTSYLPYLLPNSQRGETVWRSTKCARIESASNADSQENVYLPKVYPQEPEQNHYRSQFHPQPLVGEAPWNSKTVCPIEIDDSQHLLNEVYQANEESESIILDWDPDTRRLVIPALTAEANSGGNGYLPQIQELEIDLLSSVCTEKSNSPGTEYVDISQFQRNWGLHVQT